MVGDAAGGLEWLFSFLTLVLVVGFAVRDVTRVCCVLVFYFLLVGFPKGFYEIVFDVIWINFLLHVDWKLNIPVSLKF